MSHLSILPTVVRDLESLAATLGDLGFEPVIGGMISGFAGEAIPVDIQVVVSADQRLGWQRQADGSLALVGDLQRLSRSEPLQALIGGLTRRYALRLALREAMEQIPAATLHLAG
ncbi:DUF1257 domain-containing protein [Synechococcus sp. CS-1325]|uniref:DUF1257 domain-containing protein n=1 Tax=unclassified Synechococcus TaxID=2626047 RepID=UPI000DAFA494|nr:MULTISPECIES: DUF1257 domain-containing protein [unclassified Synechococcus]MCT0199389.1 DUF1257 domain-containing protein [Synechococcus sp. CS-1325]MCT0214446.1 DUF1257 domain-containing protein [Synechococcus sp. CS-1326]MCT0233251.1 DUF1257 domain-containing protein [Synechococcus sp. CS-1327]PZV03087.1 MAG: hypothetical protein DCF24_00215 [Cyanobium sp.]